MTTKVNLRWRHRLWALPVAATLLWHGAYTVRTLDPQYLLFVCYAANLLLCFGIVVRSPLLIGSGCGWLLMALPLWLHDAILNDSWAPSCVLFHLAGLGVGAVVIRAYRLPRHTWAFALAVGLLLQGLARLFTNAALNINAAFRIYAGWEWLYPNYPRFWLAMLCGFSLSFALFTWVHNRFYALPGEADHGR